MFKFILSTLLFISCVFALPAVVEKTQDYLLQIACASDTLAACAKSCTDSGWSISQTSVAAFGSLLAPPANEFCTEVVALSALQSNTKIGLVLDQKFNSGLKKALNFFHKCWNVSAFQSLIVATSGKVSTYCEDSANADSEPCTSCKTVCQGWNTLVLDSGASDLSVFWGPSTYC